MGHNGVAVDHPKCKPKIITEAHGQQQLSHGEQELAKHDVNMADVLADIGHLKERATITPESHGAQECGL